MFARGKFVTEYVDNPLSDYEGQNYSIHLQVETCDNLLNTYFMPELASYYFFQ